MDEGFSTAFMLLSVGMITVFTILALIVLFGNILVTLINKYFPEENLVRVAGQVAQTSIDPAKMAAIVSAVDIVTDGKAKVSSITKAD